MKNSDRQEVQTPGQTSPRKRTSSQRNSGKNSETNGVFFSAKKMSPFYKVHEKIVDHPCYNVIFYSRRTEHKY